MANLQQSNISEKITVDNDLTVNGNAVNVTGGPINSGNITTNGLIVNSNVIQSNYSVPIILAAGGVTLSGTRTAGQDLLNINLNLTRPMTVICEGCFNARPNTDPTRWIYLRFFLDGTVLKSVNMPRTDNAGHIRTLNFSSSRDNVPAGTRNFRMQVYSLGASPINTSGGGQSVAYIVKGVF